MLTIFKKSKDVIQYTRLGYAAKHDHRYRIIIIGEINVQERRTYPLQGGPMSWSRPHPFAAAPVAHSRVIWLKDFQ
jgi:hypothetical protein